MLTNLLEFLQNKKILILGFGIEGQSTYRFLRKNFPQKKLFIADKNTNLLDTKTDLIKDEHLEFFLGDKYLDEIEEYDLILKTPGISFKDIDITKFRDKISSQLELFLKFFNILTIGITGTKGKSTTSSLMYKILVDQNKEAYLLGNIGEPIFNDIEMFSENSIVVLEISSHALEYMKCSTKIGILLNIYEEHLDHYKTLEKYIEAKFNLAKYQEKDNFFIYNFDNKLIKSYNYKFKEKDYAISTLCEPETKNKVYLKENFIYCNNKCIMNINEKLNLKGMHNINNIMFILAVCDILNLDINVAINSIKNFIPLEHRMEFVGKIEDVDFYNDSIATIPEATIDAVKSIPNVNTLIVGGNDRGVNLLELIEFIKKSDIENIICLPKTGKYIEEHLKLSKKNVKFVTDLQEAVKIAKSVTKRGYSCLLSPAASSYGFFKDFTERGNLYKKYVRLT